jgi:5-formyltetrahydrofolate cyclo-ligase
MRGAVKDENREALRRAALARRKSLASGDRLSWSNSIQARALDHPQFLVSRSVVLYSPIQNEVDTGEIQKRSLALGRKVFYPRIGQESESGFYRIFSPNDLAAGPFGIAEPDGGHPLMESDRANLVVFVPGVMFDRRGNRLGRGGGWYDRMLAQLETQGIYMGLAYEFQVVDRLVAREWDRKVHYVITENGVIDCNAEPH